MGAWNSNLCFYDEKFLEISLYENTLHLYVISPPNYPFCVCVCLCKLC